MIECRTIVRDEADQFLDVMCEVFELDHARASHVFYSEPFFDISRKWALFENHRLVTVLTLSPLKFGWGDAVGIAGVATLPGYRKLGYAARLLEASLNAAAENGEKTSFLFASKTNVYSRIGFTVIDEVISGDVANMKEPGEPDLLTPEEVRQAYDAWSEQSPDRLRRDDQRWKAWRWVYRSCERFNGGYLSNEPMLCREALMDKSASAWPVVEGTRWLGLKSMTAHLGVPISRTQHELILMGRNAPAIPQMFMTDQF